MSLAGPNEKQCNEFAWKVDWGDKWGVKDMLEDGFPVDIALEFCFGHASALDHAVFSGRHGMACLLLQYGASPHVLPANTPVGVIEAWAECDVYTCLPIESIEDAVSCRGKKTPKLHNVLVAALLADPPMPTIREGFKYDEFEKK